MSLLNSLVELAALTLILTGVRNTASIPKVGVNTAKRASILRNNTINDNVTRATVVGTVATGADQLAVGVDVEVFDVQRAFAVELEDFVGGLHGTAADDVGCAGGLEEGGSVFADIFPPDVLDRTGWYVRGEGELEVLERHTRCPCSGYPQPERHQGSRS